PISAGASSTGSQTPALPSPCSTHSATAATNRIWATRATWLLATRTDPFTPGMGVGTPRFGSRKIFEPDTRRVALYRNARMFELTYELTADEALVVRAQRAERGAFAALYERHARYIAGVVYRLMGDDAELDDIVQ